MSGIADLRSVTSAEPPDVAMAEPPPAPPQESPLQERLGILRESTGSATLNNAPLTPNAATYVK